MLGIAVGGSIVLPAILVAPATVEPPANPPGGAPLAYVLAPKGTQWNLTAPSTWCIMTPDPAGGTVGGHNNTSSTGYTISCAPVAGGVQLNATQPSRISGVLTVNGSFSLYLLPSVWTCELTIRLTGMVHSCPPPFHPPPWSSWSGNFTGNQAVNLSSLPFNMTNTVGMVPPAVWSLLVIDDQSGNETATVTSSFLLSPA